MDPVDFDSAKFADVWNRVMSDGGSKSPAAPDGEVRRLRSFMNAECEAVQHIRTVSPRCCSRIRAELHSVIECDRRHFKDLRARYFILTNERYTPPELCPVVGSVIDTLRNIYITKLRIAAEYLEASDSASDRLVSDMYGELAEEEECTADLINDIITRLLG